LPDFLGLNQPDRQPSLLGVGGVEEQDGFKVAFLTQNEPSSDGSAFPRTKCFV
jgi:hypothetical protein